MEYIVGLSSQTRNFLFSLGFGALTGILYDILRIVRMSVSSSKKALYITDFIFVFAASVATFLFCLTVTDGQLRFYVIFGEALGFTIYYFSFGIIAVRFSTKTVEKIRSFFKKFFGLICAPFRKIFSRAAGFVKKSAFKSKKAVKESAKNAKILLQSNKSLLYNLNVNMHNLCRKSQRTEVKKNYESEKNEKSS